MSAMQTYTRDEDIRRFREAGRIAARARDFGLSLIEPGASHLEVSMAIEEEIRRLGGEPAFPAQISLNHVAAHYCATPRDPLRFKEGDMAKLDVGVHVNGYVGDTAATKNLGGPNLLVEASCQALERAINIISPGMPISEVGHVINATIASMGFKPVSNLTGHAVGIYQVHGPPQIPNIPDRGRARFVKGQVLAIEPFATTGRGVVTEKGQAEIFSVTGKLRMKKGMDHEVFEAIAAYNGLPFGRRNLAEHHPLDVVNPTLKALQKRGGLHGYPPLCEDEGVYISQAEHTIYVGDTVEILTLAE
jgi:methionyl aminopeptidase